MKIALIGYGKMGKTIEAIALQKGYEVVLKTTSVNVAELTTENLAKADVAIEFTRPESAAENIMKCFAAAVPVVCGSTGWLHQWDEVTKMCSEKDGSLLYASNFSIGVNLFFELNKYLSNLMKDYDEYDVTMEEIHHTQKKDAPSGTAITLAEQIMQNIGRKKKWVNHPTENPTEFQIESQRIDPAPGTHKIKYASAINDIEIIHTAHSRTGFAAGAVKAAEFLKSRKGIFTMKDVLGL